MKSILVTKHGCVFWTREEKENRKNQVAVARGEQGQTEAMLRHLITKYDVVYFGRWRGEKFMEVIDTPACCKLDEFDTGATQLAAMNSDLAALPKRDWVLAISNTGPATSMCMTDNPKGTRVQKSGMRYSSPWVHAIQALGAPHAVVNNDVRNYPIFQEMALGWLRTVPMALLDQVERTVPISVAGKRFIRTSVHGYAETWMPHTSMKIKKFRTAVVIAHAHIATGNRQRKRDAVWSQIFKDVPADTVVAGEGWEHYTGPRENLKFIGPVGPAAARRLLAESYCCPYIAPADGFRTNKPSFCLAQSCFPIPWKGFQYAATDFDHPWCMRRTGDFRKVTIAIIRETWDREKAIAMLRRKLRPNFSVLDAMCDAAIAGTLKAGDFGGYL